VAKLLKRLTAFLKALLHVVEVLIYGQRDEFWFTIGKAMRFVVVASATLTEKSCPLVCDIWDLRQTATRLKDSGSSDPH